MNAFAADWLYKSDIALGFEYTDNLFFTSSDSFNGDIGDTKLLFVPAFSVAAESESSRTKLDIGVSLERYNKVKEADRNDPFVSLDWEAIQENSRIGILLGYIEKSTRTSEQETTGQVNIFGTRAQSEFTPYWLVNLNESNSINLRLNLESVAYDVDDFIDYKNYGFSAGWKHDVSQTKVLNINMDVLRYDSEEAGLDFDYGSLNAGMDFSLSEVTSFVLDLGVGYGIRELEDNYTTGLLNARLVTLEEYYSSSLILSSRLTPSGQADLRQVHALTYKFDYQISENFNFDLDTSISESFPIDDPDGVRNEVIRFKPGLSYQMARDWFFDVWYQYRSNRNIGSDTISANSGYIGIRWRTE